MVANKLTDTKIKAIKKPGIYGDGDGLFIRMHAGGSKSWFFIYTRDGKKRELGLGSLAGTAPVSLANARRRAEELRAMLAEGRDPHAERVAAKAASEHTFQKVSEKFIAERSDWTPHTEREWKRHLLEHASALAEKAVADITTEAVEETLRPLWEKKPATGQRVRAKIESVLDYASVKKLRTGDNPARWAGHLEHLLTKAGRVTGANHKAMPYADVPGFLSTLGNSTIERLMRFIVLTAVRSGEGRLADWSEFDLSAKVWTIPKERTKTGRELIVPLSDQAVATLPAQSEGLVFVEDSEPLHIMDMPNWVKANKPGITMHGFRSAFRDFAGDETDFPREIAEMALGHKVGNEVELAYRRGDALKKRRELMEAWSNHCTRL
ncbi:site-specific integrase [Neorhizobium sp. P12A]|uniref:tyrosine-type recombinase/integrase n=1 Tax=Neorhizobium sp. P12A TaxID=2268027 RepID=UPI00165E5321|nr:site-specific integrase [Neorhizobium sp. P12A]